MLCLHSSGEAGLFFMMQARWAAADKYIRQGRFAVVCSLQPAVLDPTCQTDRRIWRKRVGVFRSTAKKKKKTALNSACWISHKHQLSPFTCTAVLLFSWTSRNNSGLAVQELLLYFILFIFLFLMFGRNTRLFQFSSSPQKSFRFFLSPSDLQSGSLSCCLNV